MPNLSDWFKAGLKKPSATDYEEHNAVGDVSTGRRFKATQLVPMKVSLATNASLSFYGFTKPGTASSQALWRIMAEDVNGNITFADGDDLFDNIFDNVNTTTFS